MKKRTAIALFVLAVFFMGVGVGRMHVRIAHASDQTAGGKVRVTPIQTGTNDPQTIPAGKVVGFSCLSNLAACFVVTEEPISK